MTRLVHVVAAALEDGAGRVLLAQRPPGKALAGTWEFPGGKLEPGETPEAALVRELDEELGICVGALEPFHFASFSYPDFHLVMLLYRCRDWQGEPVGRDGQALRWERPTDMAALPMPPADVPLVAALVAAARP
ncbi:8-oxo-dGTP diphosphatase MutT [Sandarakinorhabdus rubra]|uniref:8-oxo-dGTP diphosphatase MutT n=1 Tax=Sandarakinorhabdus rubra TaxID=2672568 RepID=UPI0013DCE132|nr:8-oxo-dGTP diphosphatase MutT [Sandarakinorhabdus rubra]